MNFSAYIGKLIGTHVQRAGRQKNKNENNEIDGGRELVFGFYQGSWFGKLCKVWFTFFVSSAYI
jgi:hypothetical protein